ncbi:MAG: hypothetical protein WCG47_14480, partial [Dermatophilaceae bacterium]
MTGGPVAGATTFVQSAVQALARSQGVPLTRRTRRLPRILTPAEVNALTGAWAPTGSGDGPGWAASLRGARA